jgi:Ser/Thr protein kinase RdoA (MazF antagonist)
MGVKTPLSLTQAQALFDTYAITKLIPTQDGIIDTTYLVTAKDGDYVLKKYERPIDTKIAFDKMLLLKLRQAGLNVSYPVAQRDSWHLYKQLKGRHPKNIKLTQIQAVGRFLASLHQETKKFKTKEHFLEQYPIKEFLRTSIKISFYYYKKLSRLQKLTQECEGFIHGDIFPDNTLFDKNSVAVFDFIDGGCGSFVFDLAVVNISFNPHARKSFTQILLRSYNQKAVKKVTLQALQKHSKDAAQLYTLLRIKHHKNTKKAKELAKLW